MAGKSRKNGNTTSRNDIAKDLEAGLFRYLTKPIKVNEFLHMLDEALEFAKHRDQPVQIQKHE